MATSRLRNTVSALHSRTQLKLARTHTPSTTKPQERCALKARSALERFCVLDQAEPGSKDGTGACGSQILSHSKAARDTLLHKLATSTAR